MAGLRSKRHTHQRARGPRSPFSPDSTGSSQPAAKQRRKKGSVLIRKGRSWKFKWTYWERLWEARYQELEAYCKRYGHCNVPQQWPKNLPLANWLQRQRREYRAGRLSPERERRLTELGMLWYPQDLAWWRHFQAWLRFKQRKGHGLVPQQWPHNPSLGHWVMKQRAKHAAGQLPLNREKALEQEGFEFAPWEDRWEEAFSKLAAFRPREGHANVPARWSRDSSLAVWVKKQRELWRKGELPPERERRLQRLGLRFEPFDEIWEASFAKLETFRRREGHANVPVGFSRDPSLGI